MIRRRLPARRRRGPARPKRRQLRRRVRIPRRIPMNANRADRAVVVESYEQGLLVAPQGQNQVFALAAFNRAMAVAACYRFYRCTKIELEFVPFANVFAPGTSFPELYFQVDRTATNIVANAPTKASMLGKGVLPIKWTSIIKKSYKPAVLRQENLITQGYVTHGPDNIINSVQPVTSTPVFNKWYMTQEVYNPQQYSANPPGVAIMPGPALQPSALLYHGSQFFVDSPVPYAQDVGKLIIKVHWEFKQPLVLPSAPTGSSSQNLNTVSA